MKVIITLVEEKQKKIIFVWQNFKYLTFETRKNIYIKLENYRNILFDI